MSCQTSIRAWSAKGPSISSASAWGSTKIVWPCLDQSCYPQPEASSSEALSCSTSGSLVQTSSQYINARCTVLDVDILEVHRSYVPCHLNFLPWVNPTISAGCQACLDTVPSKAANSASWGIQNNKKNMRILRWSFSLPPGASGSFNQEYFQSKLQVHTGRIMKGLPTQGGVGNFRDTVITLITSYISIVNGVNHVDLFCIILLPLHVMMLRPWVSKSI